MGTKPGITPRHEKSSAAITLGDRNRVPGGLAAALPFRLPVPDDPALRTGYSVFRRVAAGLLPCRGDGLSGEIPPAGFAADAGWRGADRLHHLRLAFRTRPCHYAASGRDRHHGSHPSRAALAPEENGRTEGRPHLQGT